MQTKLCFNFPLLFHFFCRKNTFVFMNKYLLLQKTYFDVIIVNLFVFVLFVFAFTMFVYYTQMYTKVICYYTIRTFKRIHKLFIYQKRV